MPRQSHLKQTRHHSGFRCRGGDLHTLSHTPLTQPKDARAPAPNPKKKKRETASLPTNMRSYFLPLTLTYGPGIPQTAFHTQAYTANSLLGDAEKNRTGEPLHRVPRSITPPARQLYCHKDRPCRTCGRVVQLGPRYGDDCVGVLARASSIARQRPCRMLCHRHCNQCPCGLVSHISDCGRCTLWNHHKL